MGGVIQGANRVFQGARGRCTETAVVHRAALVGGRLALAQLCVAVKENRRGVKHRRRHHPGIDAPGVGYARSALRTAPDFGIAVRLIAAGARRRAGAIAGCFCVCFSICRHAHSLNIANALSLALPRAACEECKHERLAAFSCKRQGLCLSCEARRMAENEGAQFHSRRSVRLRRIKREA